MVLSPTSTAEKRLWAWAAACLLTIYCSLPVVRPIANYLRDRNLLRVTVAIVFAVTGALILRVLLRNRPGKRELAVFGAFGLLYVLVLSTLHLPEERIHYLEYGFLAGLLYRALLQRRIQRSKDLGGQLASPETWALGPILGALSLNALFGWIDEGIQAVLPDRYYDLRDVVMNTLAGTIAVVAMVALRHARRLDGKMISWQRKQ